VKLLASAALLDGSTEVRLRVIEYSAASGAERRQFTVDWSDGGPGVLKGVATLARDLRDALTAALQPQASSR
jgi:hypothetical protein